MLVTTNTLKRRKVFQDDCCAFEAVMAIYDTQHFYPFFLHAFVIMPDHVHLLMNVPEHGSVSKTIGIYKRKVAFRLGQGSLWQPRFHIVIPRNAGDTIHYIHHNPVKAGLVEKAEDYRWSSASGRWDIHLVEWM